jgi:hypothetical protein
METPLISNAPEEVTQRCLKWSFLRHVRGRAEPPPSSTPPPPPLPFSAYPLLVVGVEGDEKKPNVAADTRSYVNEAEVDAVVFLCRALLSESSSQSFSPPDPVPFARPSSYSEPSADGNVTAHYAFFNYPPPASQRALDRPLSLNQSDIAVIAPFRLQVIEIRNALRAAGLGDVNVGSTQNLQGAQRPVVIFCTVLSNKLGVRLLTRAVEKAKEGLEDDGEGEGEGEGEGRVSAEAGTATPEAKPGVSGAGAGAGTGAGDSSTPHPTSSASRLPSPVGLFFDPKGTNVALTRAESLLIAVGNPRVWAKDPSYLMILQTAVDHDSYAGYMQCKLPEGVKKTSTALDL